MEKDTGFSFRLSKDLLTQFNAAAKANDVPAAHLLRDFMRRYVAKASTTPPEPRKPPERPSTHPASQKPALQPSGRPQRGKRK